jgi:AraC-like DNA-binding protein
LDEAPDQGAGGGFKLARIADLRDLEGGTYWPQLQPHFANPHYRTLRYRLDGSARGTEGAARALAVRGASGIGELDVAYIADRLAARLTIEQGGIAGYCLTAVTRGALAFSGAPGVRAVQGVDSRVGLVYRGAPGTTLAAAGDHERIALWVGAESLGRRLAALLDGPIDQEIAFDPVFSWDSPQAQGLLRLLRLMREEVAAPLPFAGSDLARRSFSDLLLYSLLNAAPHNHSHHLLRNAATATPGIVRRAEEYIRAHLESPLALHDIASAAGCSVRSLQAGFRRFRDTTPMAAIRQARLAAVRDALRAAAPGDTVTDLAVRFGFTHPGRFAQAYRAAFGESPRASLGRTDRDGG